MNGRHFCAGLALASLLTFAAPAAAQFVPGLVGGSDDDTAGAAESTPPSPNDIRELGRLLSDPRVAGWLKAQAEIAGDEGADDDRDRMTPQEWIDARLDAVHAHVVRIADAWTRGHAIVADFAHAWRQRMGDGESLRSLVYVIVFLIIGTGLEWLYWRYAWPVRRRLEVAAGEEDTERKMFTRTAVRSLLTIVGIGLFAAGSLAAFSAFAWPRLVELLVLSMLLATIGVRVINALTVLLLSPGTPALRPVPVDTPVARFVHRWLMAVAVTICVGGLAVLALQEMELVPDFPLIVGAGTGTLAAAVAIAAIWRWKQRFRGRVPDAGPATLRCRTQKDYGPVIATVVVVAIWALWLIGAYSIMWTLAIAVLFRLAMKGCGAVHRAAPGPEENGLGGDAEPAAERPATDPPGVEAAAAIVELDDAAHDAAKGPDVAVLSRRELYAPVLERLARFVLVVTAVLTIGAAWGIDWFALSASQTFAGRLVKAAVDVLVAVLIADLVWVWAKTAIDARMANYEPPLPGHAPGPEARLATLLPLLRTALLVTLIVMVGLIGLSSLGVNVAPLLASAGVIGIAIGFGAQTLVRDIVSGVFFLLDDAFRVGEYIEIDTLRGTVESISVRSLRLRHHRGPVHTIPFGEMKSLTNHSRDWVIMKLEFRVPFDTDLKLVKKLVKKIGAELQDDPELGPFLLEPLKSQGVRRMEEFNMVVGVKFMAKPGEQWVIRREAYQRIRDAFDAHGLNFAERNVKVEVVGGADLSDAEREAVAGAAQEIIERQIEAPGAARA